MEVQTADQVWARIDAAERARPGGVLATDADGTLWSGDVGDDLFHALVSRGPVLPPAHEALRVEARAHGLSDAGTGQDVARRIHAAYTEGRFPEERVCELMAWAFAGWTGDAVRAFARQVVSEVDLPSRLHPEVTTVLSRARELGLTVVLVSASPLCIVVEGGARAGFAEGQVVAARPRFAGDVMEAEVDRPIPYGSGKVRRLRELIGPDRPLHAAFGDNAFDVDLLASATVGVAVRPKPRLRERAAHVPGIVELGRGPDR